MMVWLIVAGSVFLLALIVAGMFTSAKLHSRMPRDKAAVGIVYMNPRGPKHRLWTRGARLNTKDDLGRGNHKGLT